MSLWNFTKFYQSQCLVKIIQRISIFEMKTLLKALQGSFLQLFALVIVFRAIDIRMFRISNSSLEEVKCSFVWVKPKLFDYEFILHSDQTTGSIIIDWSSYVPHICWAWVFKLGNFNQVISTLNTSRKLLVNIAVDFHFNHQNWWKFKLPVKLCFEILENELIY